MYVHVELVKMVWNIQSQSKTDNIATSLYWIFKMQKKEFLYYLSLQ